jgi:hypothetical protein
MTASDLAEQESDQDERAQRVIDDLRAQLDAAISELARLRSAQHISEHLRSIEREGP